MRERLQDLIHDLDLGDRVTLPGWVANPTRSCHGRRCSSCPRRMRGFRLSSWKQWPAAVPASATDCPTGPGEILRVGETGALVPVGDEAAMAEAMARTVDRPARQGAPAQAGRRLLGGARRSGLRDTAAGLGLAGLKEIPGAHRSGHSTSGRRRRGASRAQLGQRAARPRPPDRHRDLPHKNPTARARRGAPVRRGRHGGWRHGPRPRARRPDPAPPRPADGRLVRDGERPPLGPALPARSAAHASSPRHGVLHGSREAGLRLPSLPRAKTATLLAGGLSAGHPPIIPIVHNFVKFRRYRHKRRYRHLFPGATRLVAVSDGVASGLAEETGIPRAGHHNHLQPSGHAGALRPDDGTRGPSLAHG